MVPDYAPIGGDLPDPADPSEVLDGLEPEVAEGPLSVPIIKPQGVNLPSDIEDPLSRMR